MRRVARSFVCAGIVCGLAACAAPASPPPPAAGLAPAAPRAPVATPAESGARPATFVNRVWQVAESTAVAPGQIYVFLSEGTLVMASTTGTPAFGRWKRDGEGLIMVEDGPPYRVDILSLTGAEFRIRSHNPGEPVEIRLVPADDLTAARGQTPP